MQITIEKAKGYARGMGKLAQKSWVAEITGPMNDDFERSFPERTSVDYGDSKLYKTGKGTWTETCDLTPGSIYEICQYGERTYRIVWTRTSDSKTIFRTVAADQVRAALAVCDQPYNLMAAFTALVNGATDSKTVSLLDAAKVAAEH